MGTSDARNTPDRVAPFKTSTDIHLLYCACAIYLVARTEADGKAYIWPTCEKAYSRFNTLNEYQNLQQGLKCAL